MVRSFQQNLIGKAFRFGATNNFRSIRFFFLLFPFYFLLATLVVAQDEPKGVAPPPLKFLAKEEKSQLEAETDVKQRTKLSLELMEARLLNAETLGKQEQYREMFTELGSFHALMDNTLDFLGNSDTNKGKVLNNFKRVELSLRKYVTRLELIRRDLPIKYEFYVRRLVRYVREARTKAVEPLFGETVLPDNDNEK
ncbi:MAG: hypothetical protein H0X72_00900 [Acidobacteria bacterium]|jgi:hypothetical protein|nr:hypothetical protein [Acidobacteriota bacterium]